MTLTMTFSPLFLVLAMVSVAACGWATYLWALLLFGRRRELLGTVSGWQAVACGLTSATLLSAESWEAGALFGVAAAVCAALWQREHGTG